MHMQKVWALISLPGLHRLIRAETYCFIVNFLYINDGQITLILPYLRAHVTHALTVCHYMSLYKIDFDVCILLCIIHGRDAFLIPHCSEVSFL